jgi:putative ABC transport system permease protein
VSRPSDALEARAKADETLTALLLGLGAVAVLVGGVGIANVMVISVLERRAEIGVRRALGAARRHIRLQFLIESVLLAGLRASSASASARHHLVLRRRPRLAVRRTTDRPAGGVAAALAVAAVAGLYPAVRASRMAPATAVHSE